MAALFVDTRVSLQCRVSEKPDPTNHPLKEGKQRHDQWDCKTGTISECDWNWRFETAKAVLCAGTTYRSNCSNVRCVTWCVRPCVRVRRAGC